MCDLPSIQVLANSLTSITHSLTGIGASIQRRRLRRHAMRYVLAKSTRHLMWKIWTLALIISVLLVFGSTPVFARGGGHGGHAGDRHGRITSGTTAGGHFMNQNPCPSIDKNSGDCPQLGEKQWQTIPAEKTENRFESRFE